MSESVQVPRDLADKYRAAWSAVLYGVQGSGPHDADGVSIDEALEIAGEFFKAAGRDLLASSGVGSPEQPDVYALIAERVAKARSRFPGAGGHVVHDAVHPPDVKNSPATLAKRNSLRNHWRTVIDPRSFPHAIERVCRDCKRLRMCKWASEFTQTGKPVYKTRCNDCHNQYLNDRRRAKRPRVTSQALDRKYLAKKRCVDYLGGACARCRYDRCIKAMTFHHRDPAEKRFSVSQMLDRSWKGFACGAR